MPLRRLRSILPALALALVAAAPPASAQAPVQPDATATRAGGARPDTAPSDSAVRRRPTISAAAPPLADGVPVVLGGDTVATIRARVGSFTREERAAAVQRRLDALAGDPTARDDSVHLAPTESGIDLMVGDRVVMTVTDADARLAMADSAPDPATVAAVRTRLAQAQARAVQRALREEGFWARLRTIAVGVLFALLATFATILVFRLLNRIFPRIFEWVEAGRTTWMPAVRIQRLELVTASQLADGVLWTLKLVRVATLALLLYITIPVILSFFPWTEAYADRLFGYVLEPFASVWGAFVGFVPNMFTIGAIIVVTWYLLKLIRLVFTGLARGTIHFPNFYPEWAIPTYKIVRTLVILFAFIAIWPYLPGSDSEAFKGVGVLVGLLISFGSASAIGNAIGGVVITYMRPFRIGDRVKIADTVGDVVEKTLLVTRIRTIKNVEITIPNSMVLGSHITNYSASAKDRGLILNTTVTIGYDVPWRQVHELLVGAAREVPHILQDPAPFVLQTALNDFYVAYELNVHTDVPNRMALTYSILHQNIQDRFNEAGVEIMSPHYRAQRDGNQTTIPVENLPAEYRAPAFRVEDVGGEPSTESARSGESAKTSADG